MSESSGTVVQPRWQPLGRVERRVLGVLVEKAKTTPDAYPMTLNALTSGCNQKNNRDPQMTLEPDQVENALEKLRHQMAVIEVSGGSRVAKYRHLIYEWMGIDKVEAAVMAELLLRGTQTVGELRGRAARMDPIPDVAALQPILQSLIDKKLVLSLTAPGRGQIVTHALFTPDELKRIREEVAAGALQSETADEPVAPAPRPAPAPSASAAPSPPRPVSSSAASPSPTAGDWQQEAEQLRTELRQMKNEVERLRKDIQDLWDSLK